VTAHSLLTGFTLDPVELSVLRQAFGVRSRLFPLRLGSTVADPVRFAALAAAAAVALDGRGLAESGEPIAPVRTAFELLAEHRVAVSITGAGDKPGQDLTVLAVSDGVWALRVSQPTEHELRFDLFPDEDLVAAVAAVVAVLPPAPAAAELVGPRLGGGLLVATGRGRDGLWTDTLGWVDTAGGRHLVRTAAGRSGFSAEYRPAGPAELTAAVAGLLEVSR